jgi:hypothetical protein
MELRQPLMRSILFMAAPVVAGAALGFTYYHYIGCASGACPITGNPFVSTAYGGIIGAIWVPWNKYIRRKKEVKA